MHSRKTSLGAASPTQPGEPYPSEKRMPSLQIGDSHIGGENPVYIVAEIGINHNGEMDIAQQLIDAAVDAGCNAVKFQKRSPDACVPQKQKMQRRDTPWGQMSYIDYRHRMEFGTQAYAEIDHYCREKKMTWFASCWDVESLAFMDQFEPPCYKVASACLTDDTLLRRMRKKNKPVVLSTGMSTMEQVRQAVNCLDERNLLIMHATSSYEFNPDEVNLRVIDTFRQEFGCPVGYSGHEIGYAPTLAAVAIGAVFVERHITLDRSMWGSDHLISLDPTQLKNMVADIRIIERAMGNGVKQVYDSERIASKKLRKCRVVSR